MIATVLALVGMAAALPVGPAPRRQWVASTAAAFEPAADADFDVRDTYRGVSLAVMSEAQVAARLASVETLGPFSPQDHLQFLSHANPEARATWKAVALEVTAEHGGTVLFETEDVLVVSYPYRIGCFYPVHEVERVPVARHALVPRREAQFGTRKLREQTVRRDDIQELLTRVSRDQLYSTIETLSEGFYTRQATSPEVFAAADWLTEQYNQLGLETEQQAYSDVYSANVLGYVRGAIEPEKLVIVGAHYDSRTVNVSSPTDRAPGSDDNGSGTAAVLELARVIAEARVSFRYTVVFAHWSAEEVGLVGSAAYADMVSDAGIEVVNLNMDMSMWRREGEPITLGMKGPFATAELTAELNRITNLYLPGLPIGNSDSCCSDFRSFTALGYDAAGYFEHALPGGASAQPEYHTSDDLITNLDFEQGELFTQAFLAGLLSTADML